MPSANFTARNVTTVPCAHGERHTVYFDRSRDRVKGFVVDVSKSGTRGYYLVFRSPTRPKNAAKRSGCTSATHAPCR